MGEAESFLEKPLEIAGNREGIISRKLLDIASYSLDKVLLLNAIRKRYKNITPTDDPFRFIDNVLDFLKIDYSPCPGDMEAIPESGPLIVVANHPFGGIDGLILASVLSRVRNDTRILANYFLGMIPEIRPVLFLVDPFGKKDSARKNIASVSRAVNWIRSGGTLMTFPAGEVSHLSIKRRGISDPPWSETIGRIAQISKASVLPVFFKGKNSPLFHTAGLVHPLLRTVMLPRELLKKERSTVRLKIGNTIPVKRISEMTPGDATSYLRFRTDILSAAFKKDRKILSFPVSFRKKSSSPNPVVSHVNNFALYREIRDLPPEQKLDSSGDLSVYWAVPDQIPEILLEIGKLREITFRATGEGTGKTIDIDRFDRKYIHLFLWNETAHEIAGAYRLGKTDELLSENKKHGLYTQTLFKYKNRFLKDIGPALEMGRTFIRSEYQRSYSALLLLWKGISKYVVKNPSYRILFGAVSISKEYRTYSRQLMVTFLKMNHSVPHEMSKMIKPRYPFKKKGRHLNNKLVQRWATDLDELSSWISGIEEDDKGVPILMKQYLKMGGKFICFNVDPDFNDVLDGLIMVDLLETDRKVLSRYMGEDGLKSFLSYHFDKNSDGYKNMKEVI